MAEDWSEWKSLDYLPDYRGNGVYRIRLCESGKAICIQRFFGCDNEGLLCIGKSTNIKKRLEQFKRAKDRGHGHYEASRLSKELLDKHYPHRTYEYSFIKLDPEKEGVEEAKLLEAYFKKFGEVPPLNSNLPKESVALG